MMEGPSMDTITDNLGHNLVLSVSAPFQHLWELCGHIQNEDLSKGKGGKRMWLCSTDTNSRINNVHF